MRIRLSNPLALVAALGVVIAAMSVAHLPTTSTYASAALTTTVQNASQAPASQPLTASNFHQVALQGFGFHYNVKPWSMAWFNNKLFVGTLADESCYLAAVAHDKFPNSVPYPPPGCNPDPWALPLAGQIWSLDPTRGTPFTQANWTKVYQSPYTVPVLDDVTQAMTLAARDISFRDMAVYIESGGTPALYVGGVDSSGLNGPGVPPPSLLRSTDGLSFQAVPADPGTVLGDIHSFGYQADSFRGGVTYNGHLFVTIGNYGGSGEVFASADPSQGDNSFRQITPSGMLIYEIEPFNGHLYIGGPTHGGGYSVWRTDCAAPPPGQRYCPASAFTQIVPPGGGLGSSGNCNVVSMHVFTDTANIPHLYVGTGTCSNQGGPTELIRINQDDTNPSNGWELVMGNARVNPWTGQTMNPLSGLPEGFGWQFNRHIWRMGDYNGVLYVGTFDSSTFLISSLTPSELQRMLPYIGFDLWASADGVHFQPVTQNGFGDLYSFGARVMQGTPYGLFVGSVNGAGLRIWQGALSAGALRRAPQALQVESIRGGMTALAWDAPRRAIRFTVYRATAQPLALSVRAPLAPALAALVGPLPQVLWVPGRYTALGTTSVPYFVDRSAHAGGHYSYYVVAQDAAGQRSLASNVASSPSLLPLPTFGAVRAALATWAAGAKVSAAQVAALRAAMQAAEARLRRGDAQGSRAILAALAEQVQSRLRGPEGHLYAQELALLLGGLEKRVALASLHVLAASQLQ